MGRRTLIYSALALLVCVASTTTATDAQKGSKAARKELQLAAKYLNAKRYEQGIERLRKLIEKYPIDPSAEQAGILLKEFGAGKEVQIRLVDRGTFRKRLGVKDPDVLDRVEKTLVELRKHYGKIAKWFKTHHLAYVVYDSQARYRKAGGSITTNGHYATKKKNFRSRDLRGEVEWFYPAQAKTPKDRETSIQSSMYHECVHYLNAVHFGGTLPPLFEEGLATHFTSRLNTEFYQYYRINDRQQLESDCRLGLSWIAKYKDFLKFIESERGFGRGDSSVTRWYALCYSIVDFFEEGTVGGEKVSREKLLAKLAEIVAQANKDRQARAPAALRPRSLLERLVKDFYDTDLPSFHRALVSRIMKEYRRR